jgi:3-hydroxy-9,10-secoandrosta-1,3,5(10)-triene-9,17-dione monooxygenase
MHEEFVRAGFYRLYVPRRYGGYEFDVPTYMRVMLELSRGCPSAAWCVALASAHALQVGSWFDERAQDEIFGDGDFRAAAVAAPIGPATRTDGGWELNGKVSYASGVPYSTHYMGQALMPVDGELPEGMPDPMLLFVAPRSEWTMLDDWGMHLGLKGSGSQSIRFEASSIPTHWALENTFMVDVNVDGGTPGLRLHGNPMYGGRALGAFTLTLAALAVGMGYNALDEYEQHLRTKMTPLPPFRLRMYDDDFQRYFGAAMGKLAMAEAALTSGAEQYMELCRRYAEEGIPYSYGDDMRVGIIAREAYMLVWDVVQGDIFRTSGSSAAKRGERIERIFRDMAMLSSHRNTMLRDWAFRELARAHLGIPRDFELGNVQRARS